MTKQEVFFSTSDVADVAQRLAQVTADYEALFSKLSQQIYTHIEPLNSAANELAIALHYIHDSSRAFADNFPDRNAIACGKGCGHCCHFPIETVPQVIEDISHYLLNTRSPEQLAHLKESLQQNIEQRTAPHFRAPCPFLDEEQACTIYEKRPLTCRWFTSPEVKLCQASLIDGTTVSQHPVHSRIYEAATVALLTVEKKRSGSDKQVSFIPSLLEKLSAPAS